MTRRSLYIVLFLSALCRELPAQTTIPVVFLQDSTLTDRIGTMSRGGTLFGSLDHLARVFRIDTYRDDSTSKFELRTEAYSIKVSVENTFVLITDHQQNGNVYQLPLAVQRSAGEYYAPLESFIPILNYIVADDISYDKAHQRLVVGHKKIVSQFDVVGIDFEEKTNGYLVRLKCSRKLQDYESWLKPDGDYTWLYLTIPNARADANVIENFRGSGIFRKVMVFQSPGSVQLTFRFKAQINTQEPIQSQSGDDILVALHPASEEQVASRKVRDYEKALEKERNKWKLDVVVIDAGHGGEDPGTIGVNKTKEKDVVLSIALKLGKLLQKNLKDVRVVYTRTTDQFIELYRRGQIANQAGGKLFVSIHCNAMPHKPNPEKGFEIYLLRPGKTENALRIAERENEVVKFEDGYEKRYQQLTEENFILLTMAQSAYVKYSEKFADILQQEMGRHLDIENNGVKQAGFYVLVGASMPNVLVETAYLSNSHDEKILRSANGQMRIAEAIYSGIKHYKSEYEKTLQEGKEIGLR
jgi:N-acetylmuramoyl-L-alanine amidase